MISLSGYLDNHDVLFDQACYFGRHSRVEAYRRHAQMLVLPTSLEVLQKKW